MSFEILFVYSFITVHETQVQKVEINLNKPRQRDPRKLIPKEPSEFLTLITIPSKFPNRLSIKSVNEVNQSSARTEYHLRWVGCS